MHRTSQAIAGAMSALLATGMLLTASAAFADETETPSETPSSEPIDWHPIEDGTYRIESAVDNNYVLDVYTASKKNCANIQLYKSNKTEAQRFKLTYNASDETYTVLNAGSKLALDVANGRFKNYTNIWQYKSNKTSAQKWKIRKNSDGTYTFLASKNTELALDVLNGKAKKCANVQLYKDNDTAAQKWHIVYDPSPRTGQVVKDGIHEIAPVLDETKRLAIANASLDDKANVHIFSSDSSMSQKFYFTYDNKGYYLIKNINSGKALDAANGWTFNYTNVWQYAVNDTDAQKWAVRWNGDGTYTFLNKKSGKALDVASGKVFDKANIQLYSDNNTDAQKWKIK